MNEEENQLNLDDITAKESADDLSQEEKTYLEENKDQLSDEQADKFGISKEESEEDDKNKGEQEQFNLDPEVRDAQTSPTKDGEKDKKDEDEDDDEFDTNKQIAKEVDKKFKPLADQLQKDRNKIEVDAFIQAKPEFAKHRESAIKHLNHPAYAQIPVHRVMAMLASDELMKMGAKKERDAQQKQKESQSPGSPPPPKESKGKDWFNASPEEMAAKRAEIFNRQD